MKAAVLHRFRTPLRVEDVELAPPGPQDIRARVTACAICHSDLCAIDGGWGGDLPAVYGHEAAGVVLETGPGVQGFTPGDTVVLHLVRHCGACPSCARAQPMLCSHAGILDRPGPLRAGAPVTQGFRTAAFAEEVVVHQSQAVRVPPSLPPECAALLGCGVLTGFGAVRNTADIRPGESVAVFGTGGVGMNCVQAAAVAGAERIIAIDPDDAKLVLARTLGATHTVDPGREDAPARIRDLTGGGADCALASFVLDPAFGQALACLRRGGRMVVVGMAPDGARVALDPTALSDDGLRILGCKMGGGHPVIDIPVLVALHEAGRLRLQELVGGSYKLAEINAALAASRTGPSIRNVVRF